MTTKNEGDSTVTREIYNYFVTHILDMQKNKMRMISRYSMDYDKYTAALDILNDYIHCIEDCVNKASVTEKNESLFVIIGSTVDIRDYSGRLHSFTVVSPGNGSLNGLKNGSREVSCLGACGRALLLKEQGQEVAFEHPEGRIAGVIERIQYGMRP